MVYSYSRSLICFVTIQSAIFTLKSFKCTVQYNKCTNSTVSSYVAQRDWACEAHFNRAIASASGLRLRQWHTLVICHCFIVTGGLVLSRLRLNAIALNRLVNSSNNSCRRVVSTYPYYLIVYMYSTYMVEWLERVPPILWFRVMYPPVFDIIFDTFNVQSEG